MYNSIIDSKDHDILAVKNVLSNMLKFESFINNKIWHEFLEY